MPNRFTLPFLTAALIVGAAMLPTAARAQVPFTVDVHDSAVVMREGQTLDLKATITNNDFTQINVRAVRLMNDVPGALWYTAMCFGEQCFPPDMDIAPPARVMPGGSVEFKLTVATEETSYGTGEVRAQIRWDTGEGTDGVVQTFVVTIDGTSSAPTVELVDERAAYPNPARTSAMIPLDVTAETARVQLVDAMGRVVVDLRDAATSADGIRVDVSDVPDGAYFYRVDADGTARTGRVVVAH
jgi:hypothetical protein